MRVSAKTLIAAIGFAAALGVSGATAAPSWSVPAKGVTLFYPGQQSFDWILGEHPGADKFKAGKDCGACHIGDEAKMGKDLVSGKGIEKTPPAGKPGSVDAKVQFSHDADSLYVKIVFSDAGQPNAKMGPADTMVTMMLAGDTVKAATRAGCWGACHDDATGMAKAGASGKTMYLAGAGGANVMEYWQARVTGSTATAVSGTIADKMTEAKPAAVTAQASNAGGTYTVTLSRKLNAPGLTPLAPGKKYTVAFAIHSGHTAKRFHYVSFERSLVLDQGAADFVAK
jgi:cytochrome c-type protein NapC